jgi:diguanylate cyclase (GGDEF)-like protein
MSLFSRRALWMLTVPALLLAGAVFLTASIERKAAEHSSAQLAAAQSMLTAMLDQETGARGYFQTHDPDFLEPWYKGSADFSHALARSRSLAGADSSLVAQIDEQSDIAAHWHGLAQSAIEQMRHGGPRPSIEGALKRKSVFDTFRGVNTPFQRAISDDGKAHLVRASWLDAGVAAALAMAMAAGALLLLRRAARSHQRRLREQAELRELLQASETEQESRGLLIRHIERAIPGAQAAVLNRNNSDDRLEPLLAPGGGECTMLETLTEQQLRPRSCLAVRLSRPFDRQSGQDTLMRCETCGKIAADTACEPLLVGGQVIGSVLVAREKAIPRRDRAELRDSVVQAAPILATQRNLALAEQRAASDALTGLPNRRSAEETLHRMAAHAGRALTPLAAILLDLDHFKRINDLHGHDQGDEALAVVGQVLTGSLRASDFAARYGGEEFLVLLPDTNRAGAMALAEKLRNAIERAAVPGIGGVSASLGVAVFPDDAVETDQLLRKADRALYVAKARGRNRVESAADVEAQRPGETGEIDPRPDSLIAPSSTAEDATSTAESASAAGRSVANWS